MTCKKKKAKKINSRASKLCASNYQHKCELRFTKSIGDQFINSSKEKRCVTEVTMPFAKRFVVFRDRRETESGINARNLRFGPNSINCCSNLNCSHNNHSNKSGGGGDNGRKRVRVSHRGRTLMRSVTMLVGLLSAMLVTTGVAVVQAETYFDTSGRNLVQKFFAGKFLRFFVTWFVWKKN